MNLHVLRQQLPWRRRKAPRMPTPTNTPASSPDGDDASLQQVVGERMRPFLALFGSITAASTFLIYAGFLSDYGAYRLAELPRLSLSLTALIESGADTAIDVLALLAQGTRTLGLILLVATVVGLWALRDHRWLRRPARSTGLYRIARLGLLLVAFLVLAGLVDRAQRSLGGAMNSPVAVDQALRAAYSNGFPGPYERRRAFDRLGYEMQHWRLPNTGARLDAWWRDHVRPSFPLLGADDGIESISGIALRTVPESRREARDIFGWLALSVLALLVASVAMHWWGAWLARRDARVPPAHRDALSRWTAALHPAVERFVVPLSVLLVGSGLLLLPLAHGVLAKRSLGGESVMVYLKAGSVATTDETESDAAREGETGADQSAGRNEKRKSTRAGLSLVPEPTAGHWPAGRFDCAHDTAAKLERPIEEHDEALRDVAQTRRMESGFVSALSGYARRVDELAAAVIDSNCAEMVRVMWQARPGDGMAAALPEVAEVFRRSSQKVMVAYGVRLGHILVHPREGSGLTVVEGVRVRHDAQSPQWAVQSLRPETLEMTVVMPDLFADLFRGQSAKQERRSAEILNVSQSSRASKQLLLAPNSTSLSAVLDLLKRGRLNAVSRGVALTNVGTAALGAAVDQPIVAQQALDLLGQVISTDKIDFMPDKDERLVSSALTSLHLSQSPYAAHVLAQQLGDRADLLTCDRSTSTTRPACIGTAITAAGYHLQDLETELLGFRGDTPPPASLLETRDRLAYFIGAVITAPGRSESERTAACTALGNSGRIRLEAQHLATWLRSLEPTPQNRQRLSYGACIINAPRVAIADASLRPVLKRILQATDWEDAEISNGDRDRAQYAALSALSDLGLGAEAEFVAGMYSAPQVQGDAQQYLEASMEEVLADDLGRRLLACAEDLQLLPQQRQHCLAGLRHVKDNFDGDDGEALRVLELARSDASPEVRESACRTVRLLGNRGSLLIRRKASTDDPVASRCAGVG